MQWSPWIFTNDKHLEFDVADNTLEYDGVDLLDLYAIIKKKTINSKKRWNIVINNAEIYFTTRKTEILKVIKYVHIQTHIQLIMVSSANFYRIKPNECWFYPKIVHSIPVRKESHTGLSSIINQTFGPIGVSEDDISMLCVFWQKELDVNHLNYSDILKLPNLMKVSKMLIERELNEDSNFDAFAKIDKETKVKVLLPTYMKYLACAVFIGCFIPEDNDRHLFVSDSRSRRSKKRKMTTNRLELGPLPCSIIRILAVFKMLVPVDISSLHLNLMQMLWDLQEKALISVDDVNILCQFTYEYAQICASTLDLKLSMYFDS